MILSTSSGGSTTKDNISMLSDFGFTHICCRAAKPTRDFDKTVHWAHDVGIKVIGIFPDWFDLGMCGPEFAFQTIDGQTNEHFEGSEGRIEGPSHWHPEAEVRWRPALTALAQTGLDGILAAPMHSDRMTCTDWYPFGDRLIRYTTHFWCFDPYAKRAWLEISDEPMPGQALVGHDGQPITDMTFYRWYQNGWINRITQMANAALDEGLNEIFSWYIPLDFWDAENMADMTASSVMPLENWRQNIISRGGFPVLVNACIHGLWPRWEKPGLETMKQASENLGWASIAGAEAWGPTCFENIAHNAIVSKNHGYSGLFAGEGEIVNPSNYDKALNTFSGVKKLWENDA